MPQDNSLQSAPTILIVEDDEDLALLNARLLRRNGFNVLVAHSMADARVIIKNNEIDLFMLDVMLPDGCGFELCAELRERSTARILMLTGKTDSMDKCAGLGAGADYYLTKPFDVSELLAVIQSLLNKAYVRLKEPISADITKGSLTLKANERRAYVRGRDVGLSSSEFSMLFLLVQNEEKVLTYGFLFETVFGAAMGSDSGALRKQISRIKQKLGESNEDFSIFNEYGKGYVFSSR